MPLGQVGGSVMGHHGKIRFSVGGCPLKQEVFIVLGGIQHQVQMVPAQLPGKGLAADEITGAGPGPHQGIGAGTAAAATGQPFCYGHRVSLSLDLTLNGQLGIQLRRGIWNVLVRRMPMLNEIHSHDAIGYRDN